MLSFVSGISVLFVKIEATQILGRIGLGGTVGLFRSWYSFLCYFDSKAYCRLQMFYSSSTSSKMFCVKKISVIRADDSECSAKLLSAKRNYPRKPSWWWWNLPLFQFNYKLQINRMRSRCVGQRSLLTWYSESYLSSYHHHTLSQQGKEEDSTVTRRIKRNPLDAYIT